MELIVRRVPAKTVTLAIVVVAILAPSFTTTNAYGPSPLQNFCVADYTLTLSQIDGEPSLTTQEDDNLRDFPHLDYISEGNKVEFNEGVRGADNISCTDELIEEDIRQQEDKKGELKEIEMQLVEYDVDAIEANKIFVGDAFFTEQVFNSDVDAIEWITTTARNVGMVLIRWRSDFSKGRSPYIKYACERGGEMREQYVKKVGGAGKGKPRNSLSKKCGCPFLLLLRKEKNGDGWCITMKNGFHNHSLNKSDLGHSFKGRLSKSEKDLVASMTLSRACPKDILKTLRAKNLNNATSIQTIYNERVKLNKSMRDNRTVIQEVFHQARAADVFLRYTQDGDIISNVFWAPKNSLLLANNFPHVFLIDCTYKTNMYKFPLLQIVGVTSTNITYSVAFAYLGAETTETYEWALRQLHEAIITNNTPVKVIVTDKEQALMSAIRTVFPTATNLLCQWHVEKAVKAKVRPSYSAKESDDIEKIWKCIVYSDTEEQFLAGVDEIKKKVSSEIFSYLETNWLDDCKDKYVNVWTNKVFHLGNTHNGKVEGAHSTLKSWLSTSYCDMATGWASVASMCEQQFRNIVASFEISRTRWPVNIYGKEWCRYLRGVVSLHGLELIKREVERSKEVVLDQEVCGCAIRQTHGLPCAHEILAIFRTRESLPRNCVDAHWKTLSLEGPSNDDVIDPTPHIEAFRRIFEDSTITQQMELVQRLREVVEPGATMLSQPKVKMNPRGRPKSSLKRKKANDERSTKREPSLFEHVEKDAKKEEYLKKKVFANEKKAAKRVKKK